MVTAYATKSKTRIQWPWFILLFCMAAVANTYLPIEATFYPVLSHLGKVGLTVVLFLIGTGLSKNTIRRVGIRPFLQCVCLWAVIATASLLAIGAGWITL